MRLFPVLRTRTTAIPLHTPFWVIWVSETILLCRVTTVQVLPSTIRVGASTSRDLFHPSRYHDKQSVRVDTPNYRGHRSSHQRPTNDTVRRRGTQVLSCSLPPGGISDGCVH